MSGSSSKEPKGNGSSGAKDAQGSQELHQKKVRTLAQNSAVPSDSDVQAPGSVGPLLKRRRGAGLGRAAAASGAGISAEECMAMAMELDPQQDEAAPPARQAEDDRSGARARDLAAAAAEERAARDDAQTSAREAELSRARMRQLGMSSRRSLLELRDNDFEEVLQQFLVSHSATGTAVTVQHHDVREIRRSLLNDMRLTQILSKLLGAGSGGAHESGSEYWARMIDVFIGKLHFRQMQQAGPRFARG